MYSLIVVIAMVMLVFMAQGWEIANPVKNSDWNFVLYLIAALIAMSNAAMMNNIANGLITPSNTEMFKLISDMLAVFVLVFSAFFEVDIGKHKQKYKVLAFAYFPSIALNGIDTLSCLSNPGMYNYYKMAAAMQ